LMECYSHVAEEINEHFDFSDHLEELEKNGMFAEIKKKLIKVFNLSRKESIMDEKQLKEFQEKQTALENEKKALETQVSEFKEKERLAAEAKEKARVEKADAGILAFKEKLTAEKYPVAKMEEDGVFALGKQLLLSSDLAFGEGKKKSPMDVLRGLIANYPKVDTSVSEFADDTSLARKQKVTTTPVRVADLQFVEKAYLYLDKHKDEFKELSQQEALASVLTKAMRKEIIL
jgi:hypothetical protein